MRITRLTIDSKSSGPYGQASQNVASANAAFSSMSSPVSATVNELRYPPSSFVATFSVDGGACPRTPADAHPVRSHLFEFDRVEARRHVGAEVLVAGDLVEQLRRDGPDGDRSPGAVVLADHRRAVGRHLSPRESEAGAPADLVAAVDLV